LDDRRRDGGTNSTLRTKEQGRHLTLDEHDNDDDDDEVTLVLRVVMDELKTRKYVLKCIFN